MMLVKRTVVLSKGAKKGYLVVVRVGGEVGVKIVGDDFSGGMTAYIKIGRNTEAVNLGGKKTERDVKIPFSDSDDISCAVIGDGKVVADGGKAFSENELSAFINAASEDAAPNPETDATRNAETNASSETLFSAPPPKPPVEKDAENAVSHKKKEQSAESEEPKENAGVRDDLFGRLSAEKSGFYISISDKIDELFVVYPVEKSLSAVIPDSEWVKINYDKDEFYVVGRLYENNKVAYLGYGVPGVEKVKPPKAAGNIASWMPVSDLEGYEGYWLFFQDAETGKIDG
jgi:hypothetical protein